MVVHIAAAIAAVVAWACSSEPDSRPSTATDAATTPPDSFTQSSQAKFTDDVDTLVHSSPDIYRYSPKPQFPASSQSWYGKISILGKSPCGSQGLITDIDSDGYGLCSNFGDDHRLFHIDSAGITTVHKTDLFPDQVLYDGRGRWWITALAFTLKDLGKWGVAEIQLGTEAWYPFPELMAPDDEVGLGRAMALTGNTLFVTGTSLFSPPMTPPASNRVLPFHTTTVQYGAVAALSGDMPCAAGVAPYWGSPHAVLFCAGTAASTEGPQHPSRIYIMDTAQGIAAHTELPLVAAPTAELAVQENHMAVGTADGSARVFILGIAPPHLPVAELKMPEASPGMTHTLSTVVWHPDAPLLLTADVETGRIAIWNLQNIGAPKLAGDSAVDEFPGDGSEISDAAWIQDRWVIAVGNQLIQVE